MECTYSCFSKSENGTGTRSVPQDHKRNMHVKLPRSSCMESGWRVRMKDWKGRLVGLQGGLGGNLSEYISYTCITRPSCLLLWRNLYTHTHNLPFKASGPRNARCFIFQIWEWNRHVVGAPGSEHETCMCSYPCPYPNLAKGRSKDFYFVQDTKL